MFIQFGNCQIKLLIPILFPIFLKVRRFIRRKNSIKSAAFKGFNDFLSLTLCGFFYLIILINTKSTKNDQKKKKENENEFKAKNENSNILIDKDANRRSTLNNKKNFSSAEEFRMKEMEKQNKRKLKKIWFVGIISFLQLIAVFIKNLWKDDIQDALKLNLSVLMEVIFFVIFSMKFLGLIIYKHQIFSMIVISILLIIFFIEAILYEKDNDGNPIGFKQVILSIIYYFGVQLFYSLSDVLGKKYLNSLVGNVYSFLFKVGIIGLIPLTIYGIIMVFVNPKDINIIIFQNFVGLSPWIYILDLIFSLLFEIGLWLTIYYFTPCHYIIFELIADFLEIILSEFEDNIKFDERFDYRQKISFFILYPILIFIVLVFNEIIILNFCNLSYNTKIKIMEREKRDSLLKEKIDNKLMDEIEEDNSDDEEDGYINEGDANKNDKTQN